MHKIFFEITGKTICCWLHKRKQSFTVILFSCICYMLIAIGDTYFYDTVFEIN